MLTAKDIMTREVCSVHEETELKDLSALFVEHNYKTLPVVDSADRLVGIVSQTDLIEQDKPLHIPTVISLFDWVLYLESPKAFSEEVRKVSARKVGEICARDVVTCAPTTPVDEIASLMVEHKIHLLPVLDGDPVGRGGGAARHHPQHGSLVAGPLARAHDRSGTDPGAGATAWPPGTAGPGRAALRGAWRRQDLFCPGGRRGSRDSGRDPGDQSVLYPAEYIPGATAALPLRSLPTGDR